MDYGFHTNTQLMGGVIKVLLVLVLIRGGKGVFGLENKWNDLNLASQFGGVKFETSLIISIFSNLVSFLAI